MNRKIVYTIIAAVGCGYWASAGFCYESNGKRDPFIPLIGQEKGNRPSSLEEITLIEDVLLEGIAIGPMGKNIAILNGQMVKEKDKFGVIQIKKISKNTVELSIDEKIHTLSLQEEKGIKVGE
ncbi:MAG: hypothetical protein NTY34_02575 [Candidatus Omnitrophica bacterium]|nr:hypothetical protein [Candidatus Omnitrophota bacterium]